MRTLVLAVFVLLAASGLVLALSENLSSGLWSTGTIAGPAAAPSATTPATANTFAETGTLDYYPDSAGVPVPYLVYKLSNGTTATKDLAFAEGSSCEMGTTSYPCPLISDALQSYYGGTAVTVTGTVSDSSLVVSTIAPS